jgi:hypothetical protein
MQLQQAGSMVHRKARAGRNVPAGRRIGVSAFAKLHQLRRDLLVTIGTSKSSFASQDADTPTRRHAGTFPEAPSRV